MTNHSLLCNNLKSFSWKVTHGALCTREKLFRWGISDGKCPFCSQLESISHIFWDCPSVHKVLCWLSAVTTRLFGDNDFFQCTSFLYGLTNRQLAPSLWARLWFIYVVTKKAIWNRRCSVIFEKEIISEDTLLLRVKEEIRIRLLVDLRRWSKGKFRKIWTQGRSFCSISGEGVKLNLPGI